MTWCNDCIDVQTIETSSPPPPNSTDTHHHQHHVTNHRHGFTKSCPSCGHQIKCQNQARLHDLPGLPAGVKFDPTDQELLEHLEGKVKSDVGMLHPLIDEFIPTIDGENGICYTHPERLPGVSKDGLVRHFFHRPSKAYTTGTRKRRKVHSDDTTEGGGETRWHKTGKTRAVQIGGKTKGYKKILVLYTNYGKQKKPEKTSWVMHQYHLGSGEDEKDGELVVSKVFYQTQPRQCKATSTSSFLMMTHDHHHHHEEYYGPNPNIGSTTTTYSGGDHHSSRSLSGTAGVSHQQSSQHLMNPHFTVHDNCLN